MKYRTLSVLFLFFTCSLYAQINYRFDTQVMTGRGDYSPFYFVNNQHGNIPLTPNNGLARFSASKETDLSKTFSYGFGAEIAVAYNNRQSIWLQALYAKLKYSVFGAIIGKKELSSITHNPNLSSGSVVWSGNAPPVPQLEINIPRYVTIPKTDGLLHLKGAVSFGAFTDNDHQKSLAAYDMRYATDVFFHRKNLLFKLQKESAMYGVIGVDMAAQFGGKAFIPWKKQFVEAPVTFNEVVRVFFGLSGGDDSPEGDKVNVAGNHLGAFILEFGNRFKNWEYKLYHEHLFDDHSGIAFKNRFDGLWGIEIKCTDKKNIVSNALIEWIYTKHQSGPFLWDKTDEIPVQVSSGDDYYNNYFYPGWTHYGYSMGTPFITSPMYNADHYGGFYNNRVNALHIGISGYFSDSLSYRFLGSHANGWGTPNHPFLSITTDISTMFELSYTHSKLSGWQFSSSAAWDKGDLIGNNVGLQLKITKTGMMVF